MASSSPSDPIADDDPAEIVENGRYERYDDIIEKDGKRTVYKAMDAYGWELAWNKTELTANFLSNDALVEKLRAEAEKLKSLKHENVMRYMSYSFDYENKVINMIAERFYPVDSLEALLKRNRVFTASAIKNRSRQILQGLEYLHSQGIVHWNLRCDNIFILGEGLKIGDTGLTQIYEQQDGAMQSSSSRPEFMAPELIKGGGGFSQLTDIYAFGMCVLQMATRKRPYSECVDEEHVRRNIRAGVRPEALDGVQQPGVVDFINQCLCAADKRPTASDLLRDSFFQSTGGSRFVVTTEQMPERPQDLFGVGSRFTFSTTRKVGSRFVVTTTTELPEVTDTVQQPEVTDTVQQPERSESQTRVRSRSQVTTAQQPEVTDTMQQPEVTDTLQQPDPLQEQPRKRPRVTITQQPQVTDAMQQPQVTDPMQQPEVTDPMQQPEVTENTDTIQQPEVTDMHID